MRLIKPSTTYNTDIDDTDIYEKIYREIKSYIKIEQELKEIDFISLVSIKTVENKKVFVNYTSSKINKKELSKNLIKGIIMEYKIKLLKEYSNDIENIAISNFIENVKKIDNIDFEYIYNYVEWRLK